MVKEFSDKLIENVQRVIKGKTEELTVAVGAIIAGGNILLDDVPGTGKTVLSKAIATSLGCDFKRIQFTPDLLPSDITGINFFNMKTQEFVLRKGAVFTNVLLADEINRATPRTQSALLEAMEEKQVTIDGESMPLPVPFTVIATQNPVETSGTFPLPEAQLDRFMIRLSMGYANSEAEAEILSAVADSHPVSFLEAVSSADELLSAIKESANLSVNKVVIDYIASIGSASRSNPQIKLGLSTRGLIALKRMAQALAAMEGCSFVTPDHVKKAARYVVPHRLIASGARGTSTRIAQELTEAILESVPVPTEELGG